MMFWKYFGFVFILFKHSEPILGNEGYEVYTEAVTWSQALQNCEKVSSKLVSFNPENFTNNTSSLKREIYHHSNESWVGDYVSYELVADQQMNLSETDSCVELRVTKNSSVNPTHYIYEYQMFSVNCTKSNTIICQEYMTGFNISNDQEPWPGSCYPRNLWMPPFETYSEAHGSFGYGNYTTTERLAAGKTYWTGYRLQQFKSEIPVRGNILRCGYINTLIPAILYDECSANKSYACNRISSARTRLICNNNNTESKYWGDVPFPCDSSLENATTSPALDNETTSPALDNATTPPGLYAGVCLAAAVVITLTVAVTIFLRRKQFSFCKLLKTNKEGKNLFRSWSSESQKSSAGLVFENNNLTSDIAEELQPDNPIVAENPIYAIPFKNTSNLQTNQSENILTDPVVAPQTTTDDNTILVTRYLTMEGSTTEEKNHASSTNNSYDFIESYRGTNISRYKDLKRSDNDSGNNAYGMVAVSKESFYDHTSSFRSNENKVEVSETTYDHVALDSPGAKTEKESDAGKEKTRPVPAPLTSVNSEGIYEDIVT